MIYLASSPFNYRSLSILHLVHPKNVKDQFIINEIDSVESESTQICKVGETMLNEARFNHFRTIYIHSCDDKLIHDYLRRLMTYTDRLKKVLSNHSKNLIVVGNALSLISDKMFYLDKTANLFINDLRMSSGMDINTEGLNIISDKFDYNFNVKEVAPSYLSVLKKLSMQYDINLLTKDAVVDNTGKISRGNVFIMHEGNLKSVKNLSAISLPLRDSNKITLPKT